MVSLVHQVEHYHSVVVKWIIKRDEPWSMDERKWDVRMDEW
jgi:hypothetical protein